MIFAAEMQNWFARLPANINKGKLSMRHLPDHGLPLVQLKEQRRDLVVALQNHLGPISGWQLMEIAAIQQTISAFEEVIADLDRRSRKAAINPGCLKDSALGPPNKRVL